MAIDALKRSLPEEWRKSAKVARARLFESLGSDRYSYPALHSLDRTMLRFLPDKGFFLEVGANDGYSQSNTYYLERWRGWSGILIEPVPRLYARLCSLRKNSRCFNVACVARDAPNDTVEVFDLDLRSVTRGQQAPDEELARLGAARRRGVVVPAMTISAVIDCAGNPNLDFMSLDVEGAELQVLAGLQFELHTPSWLLIETAHLASVMEFVAPWMTTHSQLTHHDYLFKKR